MSAGRAPNVYALQEKVAALRTLIHYEQDIQKLTFYTRELEMMLAALRVAETGQSERQSNVLPFAPKKPPRSA